ncbi:transforming growth factor beta like domain protein [Cooperia oncophora]
MKTYKTHSKERATVPRRKKVRGNRRKAPEDDIWHGFGDDTPPFDEENKEESAEKSNDVRVVLLGAEEKRAMCQKRDSVVDLKQLGWGRWVIAPADFEAGFCSGICPDPLPKDMHPSNHALLQTLLKSASVPSVCCSPSQTRSLTIFYRDELGRSTIRNFENMIIESCTCQ